MAHKYIVWIALISASSAYRGYDIDTGRQPHQIFFQERRHYSPAHYRYYQQNYDFSDFYGYPMNERQVRANERSIPVNSELLNVQEAERRRSDTRKSESSLRNQNGSYKIVNMQPKIFPVMSNRNGQTHDSSVAKDGVIFPGPTSKSSISFVPDIPETCKKTGICEKILNYPREHVDKKIEMLNLARYKLNMDQASVEISQRGGQPPGEDTLCSSIERPAIPESLQDLNKEWKIIVNRPDENALQVFRIEICNTENQPCNKRYADFNFKTYCKQKYVNRSMLALNSTTGEIYSDYFRLPSCCSCIIKTQDYNV